MTVAIRAWVAQAVGVLALAVPLAAQQAVAPDIAKNAAYFEFLGNGGLYSVNYERRVARAVAIRIGGAQFSSDGFLGGATTDITSGLVMVNALSGAGGHKLELGVGIMAGRISSPPTKEGGFANITGVVGYRYDPARGTVFRVGVTPFVALSDGPSAYPDNGGFVSVGASFGLAF
ncbi:MAG: hypothetical protein NVS4B3_06920 [Gemmatimonadaceae bacterium]